MASPIQRGAYAPAAQDFSPTSLNWEWLNQLQIYSSQHNLGKVVDLLRLENTVIGFCTSNHAGKLENRLAFVKKVVEKIIQKSPKSDEIALVDLGCDHLLMDYFFVRALIENGYQNFSLYLIEPTFLFTTLPQKHMRQVRDEFREKIGKVYAEKWNQPLPKDSIHFLTRAEKIKEYFKKHTNVVLVESLPPHGALKNPAAKNIAIKPEELFTGSTFVPPEHANAITFIPTDLLEQYKKAGVQVTHTLPSNCMDWGCKIYPDGRFFIHFFGAQDYYETAGLEKFNATFPGGKIVPFSKLAEEVKTLIEGNLRKKIDLLIEERPDGKLSQADTSSLLLFIGKQITDLELGWSMFFTADYAVDRSVLVEFYQQMAASIVGKPFLSKMIPTIHAKSPKPHSN